MPTIKQKKAFTKVVENGGNVSRAMQEVGYSPNTAKTPSKLTDSTGWKELMDTYLPDTLLAKVHKEGLGAEKKVFKNNDSETVSEEPDYPTRHKYLDTAYKLKGLYAPEKRDFTTLGEKIPGTDLDALANAMAEELKKNKI